MRWLIHGTLTPAAGEALRRHGHTTRLPAEISLAPDAPAEDVLREASKNQLDLITADAAIASAPYEQRLSFGRSIVLLNVENGDVEQDDAIDRLFERYKRLTPGRLYTVTGSRVKIRQLPG
ncbi:MAG TPA: hypothetical protein VH370_03010 [Humisphaera sp.]|jgi:hypothetical protein|nr:hypothetical protein [Humisphaera sp.]